MDYLPGSLGLEVSVDAVDPMLAAQVLWFDGLTQSVDRSEFVNVGVVVYCQSLGYLAARITSNLDRALALDSGHDVVGVHSHLEGVRATVGWSATSAAAHSTARRRPPGQRRAGELISP
jgi:Protein of unknown function (DUF3037)